MYFNASNANDGFIYMFDDGEKTVKIALYDINRPDKKVIIPQFITFNDSEFPISRVCSESFKSAANLESIEFAPDSKVFKINESAFLFSSISTLSLPASLIELEKRWCNNTPNLNHITISPDNPRYKVYDNKFIIGKSSIEKVDYDILLFAVRNIEIATIPSSIEIIETDSFNSCKKLQKVEFSDDSKLRAIESYTFTNSTVKTISFPSTSFDLLNSWSIDSPELTEIVINEKNQRYKFYDNQYMIEKVDQKSDTFDCLVFASRNIEIAKIPDFVVVIKKSAFNGCLKLKRVETSRDSKLQTIEQNAFYKSPIESILIPPSFSNFNADWCFGIKELKCIEIDPQNKKFMSYENQFILSKSSPENQNFDVLVFAVRNIKNPKIPDFIEIIESCAFEKCKQLETVIFSENSKLHTICDYAFSRSTIKKFKAPFHLTKICDGAFFKCKCLRNFDVPLDCKLEVIEKDAFYNAGIEKFYCPSNISRIYDGAFNNCPLLREFTFPLNSKVTLLDYDLFMQSKLTSFLMPSSVKKICSSCFEDCTKMKKFEIPENSELEVIEKNAFFHSAITSFSFPKKVSVIGENIFTYCYSLQIIEFCDDFVLTRVNPNIFGIVRGVIMVSSNKRYFFNIYTDIATMTD